MEGTVTLVSDEGEYGTHVKIVNKDVTTIYAHCSKILVKKGEKVTKGQKIANKKIFKSTFILIFFLFILNFY